MSILLFTGFYLKYIYYNKSLLNFLILNINLVLEHRFKIDKQLLYRFFSLKPWEYCLGTKGAEKTANFNF